MNDSILYAWRQVEESVRFMRVPFEAAKVETSLHGIFFLGAWRTEWRKVQFDVWMLELWMLEHRSERRAKPTNMLYWVRARRLAALMLSELSELSEIDRA